MSNGFPRVQKPPLVYWTMLVSTSLFGENEFALRLPNALADRRLDRRPPILIMRRLGGERFGSPRAVVLASMLGVWVFNHLVQPEPFLACFISLAFWCLVEARASAPRRPSGDRWYLLFWIFLALGAMSKGLHGALWPLGTVGLTALFVPGWRPWLRPVLNWRGPGAFLLLVAPWYAYMAARFPGFLVRPFRQRTIGRRLNTRFPADARQLPLAAILRPASPLLDALDPAPARRHPCGGDLPLARRPRCLTRDRPVELLGIWVGLVMVSVAFSTRQDYYSMSCWGVVAAFLALPWIDSANQHPAPAARFAFRPVPSAGTGGNLLRSSSPRWPHSRALGRRARPRPSANRDTFMDAIAGISPALWGQFLILLCDLRRGCFARRHCASSASPGADASSPRLHVLAGSPWPCRSAWPRTDSRS